MSHDIRIRLLGGAILAAIMAAPLANAISVDVQDASDGGVGNYFVPTDAQKNDSPYYRWYNEDWGWTHDPITETGFTSASLSISGFDIDFSSGERDVIKVMSGGTVLGDLAGGNNIWAFTTFTLDVGNPAVVAAINNGLDVWIDIDSTHNTRTWAVTLAKSVLEVDGGTLPTPIPIPGVPDGGGTLLLLGLSGFAIRSLKRRLG